MLLPTEQQPFLTQGRPQHKKRTIFPDTNEKLFIIHNTTAHD